MTSVRSTYLVPFDTARPSCIDECIKHNASPIFGVTKKSPEESQAEYEKRLSKTSIRAMGLGSLYQDKNLRALARAAGRGNPDKLNQLVQNVDVNAVGTRGVTALFWALRKRHLPGFKRLLELGADPNPPFGSGRTVLHWAGWYSRSDDFMRLALEHGGDPNIHGGPMGGTPIFDALLTDLGQTERIRLLIEHGADVNARGGDGDRILVAASFTSRYDVMLMLIEAGADVSETWNGKSLITLLEQQERPLRRDSEMFRLHQLVYQLLLRRQKEAN